MNEPTHLDLFTGIGGFTLAAQAAGFRTVGFCEIEPFAQRIIQDRFGAVVADAGRECGSVGRNAKNVASAAGEVESEALERQWMRNSAGNGRPTLHPDIFTLRGYDYAGVDLITGGFPCQPFSLAGKRRGASDDRAIWPQMLRVIAEARPRWVLAENVPGIINMELDRVLSDLEAQGYTVGTLVVPACAVDARHRRDRVWIVANTSERRCPGTESGQGQQPGRAEVVCTGEAPAWIPCPDGCGEFWCTIHEQHAFECPCPPIEEWGDVDPYSGRELPQGWQGESTQGSTQRQSQPCLGGMADGVSRWLDEPPGVHRVAKGVKERVARLKGLGNAIVPQVAFQILRHINTLLT